MAISKKLHSQVITRLERCVDVANDVYGDEHNFTVPSISYDCRGTKAGTANDRTYHIQLNQTLLEENGDEFINRTVVHEFAHLVDGLVFPHTRTGRKRSIHGNTWKHIMALFGASPSRCHSYDVSNVQTKIKHKFAYKCDCGKILHMGPVRHKRHQRYTQLGVGGYIHCRGRELTFIQPVGQVSYKEAAQISAGTMTANIPKKSVVNKRPAKKGSKMAMAMKMFTSRHGIGRKMMIGMFMDELNMSKAGASTYYYNIQKKLEV